jgi:hypothetical protein
LAFRKLLSMLSMGVVVQESNPPSFNQTLPTN